MKHIFVAMAAAALWLCGFSLSAQTLQIHMSDGTVQTLNCADVDSIVMAPAAQEGPAMEISVEEVKASRAHIVVACDDPDVRYYFDVCTLEAYERNGCDAAAMVDNLVSQMRDRYPQLSLEQILEGLLDSGTTDDVIRRLPSSTDMVCYVVPVDNQGHSYGTPAIARFRTLEAGNPADCTFDIKATGITTDGCTVEIIPSDESVKYWYGICARDNYPGDMAMALAVKAAFAEAASQNGWSVSELIDRISYTDEISEPESGLERDAEYYIFAYALNSDGSNASPLSKILFKTSAYDESEAAINLSYRYFDGDALYQLDPVAYEKYRDRVLVQYHVTPNELAAHWAVALGIGDMTDPDLYPDEATKNALLQVAALDAISKEVVARWGEATFVYFAADAAGIDGPLKRLKVNFTREGAQPVSQYEPIAVSSSAQSFELAPSSMADSTVRRAVKKRPGTQTLRNSYRHN